MGAPVLTRTPPASTQQKFTCKYKNKSRRSDEEKNMNNREKHE
jgi:hypothetical protein